MKKIFLLASFLTAFAWNALAQDNVIKLNLPRLVSGKISLNYERVLSPGLSANVELNYAIPRSPGYFVNSAVEGTNADLAAQLKLSSFAITPELRIYTSSVRSTPRGFYFAPYFRFANAKLEGSVDDGTYQTEASGSINTFVGGVSIGNQWLINDRISIDVTWIGLGFGRYGLNFTGTTNDPDIDFIQDVANIAEAIPMIEFEATGEANNAKIKANVLAPHYRILEVRLGYAF